MEPTGREAICVYCGERELTGEEKPEHAVPCALGSDWTVSTASNSCNGWAGANVDQPFLRDALIRHWRHEYDVRDPRHPGRREASPFMHGAGENGDWIVTDDHGTPHLHNSRIIDAETDGMFDIVAETQAEHDRLLDDLRREADSIGWTIEAGEPEWTESWPRIHGRMQMEPTRWLREAAKIALAASSAVYPASWRTSSDAALLRHWMRDPEPRPGDQWMSRFVAGTTLTRIAPPSSHVVFFTRDTLTTRVTILLFGEIAWTLPVDTAGLPTPATAWFADPRRGRPGVIRGGRTTLAQLIALRDDDQDGRLAG